MLDVQAERDLNFLKFDSQNMTLDLFHELHEIHMLKIFLLDPRSLYNVLYLLQVAITD